MQIRYIGFKLGNWKSDKLYGENAKPRVLSIRIGDMEQEVTFTGNHAVEWVQIDNAPAAFEFRITIKDIYTGSTYDDTVITEVMPYGTLVEGIDR